jgi:hypothetical protein
MLPMAQEFLTLEDFPRSVTKTIQHFGKFFHLLHNEIRSLLFIKNNSGW